MAEDEPGLAERLQAQLGPEFVIGRELGGGGMSRVFLARETTLARDVVVSSERVQDEYDDANRLQRAECYENLHATGDLRVRARPGTTCGDSHDLLPSTTLYFDA